MSETIPAGSPQEAKLAAAEMLKLCKCDSGLPVNPFAICDMLGVQVKLVVLPNDVAGGILKEPNGQPIIFVNKADHPNRQRFTCAHELGHYYRRFKEQSYEYYDKRDTMSSLGLNPEEVFANQFAANLLMPEEHVKTLFQSMKAESNEALATLLLSTKLCVSTEALSFRLKNLGLV